MAALDKHSIRPAKIKFRARQKSLDADVPSEFAHAGWSDPIMSRNQSMAIEFRCVNAHIELVGLLSDLATYWRLADHAGHRLYETVPLILLVCLVCEGARNRYILRFPDVIFLTA